jgi:hypothetical protein
VADLVGVHLRREASGVLVRDGLLLVVSDNTGRVAILDPDLALCGPHREIPLRVDGVAATRASPPIPRPGGCLCWSKRCRHVAGAGLKPLAPPIGADDQLEPHGRQHQLADFGRRTSSGLGITLKVASGGLATSSGGRDVARAQHVAADALVTGTFRVGRNDLVLLHPLDVAEQLREAIALASPRSGRPRY